MRRGAPSPAVSGPSRTQSHPARARSSTDSCVQFPRVEATNSEVRRTHGDCEPNVGRVFTRSPSLVLHRSRSREKRADRRNTCSRGRRDGELRLLSSRCLRRGSLRRRGGDQRRVLRDVTAADEVVADQRLLGDREEQRRRRSTSVRRR